MLVKFANVPLTPPAGAQSQVDAFWHGYRIRQFDYPFFSSGPGLGHLPLPASLDMEPPRIGVLNWPTSASRWATCHLVATGTQLASVRAQIGNTPTAKTLVLTDGIVSISTSMFLVDWRPITQGKTGGEEFYLLTLTDERYYWWMTGNTSSPTTFASWSSLLTSLLSNMGVSATIDTIPSGYGTPTPIRWNVGYEQMPVMVDAVCQTVGLRLVRQLDGTVRCQSYANAAAQDETNWGLFRYEVLTGGREEIGDIARTVPANCSVIFKGNTQSSIDKSLSSLSIPDFSGYTGVASRSAFVVADTPNSASTSAKNLYATQAATDYFQWALSRTDCTLRGLQNRQLTGLDHAQEWACSPDYVVTRVFRLVNADRSVYGESNTPPSGWVPGSGSGSILGCDGAIRPITFTCDSGTRKATVSSMTVSLNDDGELVLAECAETEYPLGPCSPNNPGGTPVAVALKVCPVFTTLQYLDWNSLPQTLDVVTGIIVERQMITVPVADVVGCIEFTECCGTGSAATYPECITDCDECGDGMSSDWDVAVTGELPITVTHVTNPDDGNYCRFISADLQWDLRYEADLDLWTLTNHNDGRMWFIDGALWDCIGTNDLTPVDEGQDAAVLSPYYDCSEVTYNCTTGGCVAVAGSGGTYATLALCNANCSTPAPCPDGNAYTNAEVFSKTGDCTCLPNNLIYQGPGTGDVVSRWGTNTCPGNYEYRLRCVAGQYVLTVVGVGDATLVSYVAGNIVFDLPNLSPGCNGTAQVVIT